MDRADVYRELEKIADVVDLATTYFKKQSESNAALHASSKVLYSPLATKLILLEQSFEKLFEEFRPEEDF